MESCALREVTPGSTLARAGLRNGDRFQAVFLDGCDSVFTVQEMPFIQQRLVENDRLPPRLTLVFSRPGLKEEIRVPLDLPLADFGYVGISEVGEAFEVITRYPPGWTAVRRGMDKMKEWTNLTVSVLVRIVRGKIKPGPSMGGPVKIIQSAWLLGKKRTGNLAYFLALISLNLAIINLLPVPILDGGVLVVLIAEALKRRPLKEKTLISLQILGLVFIATLVVLVTFNDVRGLF